jgi:hypothetical protein
MKTEKNTFYQWIHERFPNGTKGFKVNAENAADWIDSLTKELPGFIQGSTGLIGDQKTFRKDEFKLRDYSHGTHEVSRPEDLAQIAILKRYWDKEFCGTEKSAFLRSIHSYQVPVAAKQGDKLGKVDLLGSTDEGLPAVIELKCLDGKGRRSVGGLLGPIIQGLAYALTIRHYWDSPSCGFRDEWSTLVPGTMLPPTLDGRSTPIIVAADSSFWDSPSRWSRCPWPLFVNLAEALEKAKLPLFAARFEPGKKPILEFAKFADLKGWEDGTKPLGWPTSGISDREPH